MICNRAEEIEREGMGDLEWDSLNGSFEFASFTLSILSMHTVVFLLLYLHVSKYESMKQSPILYELGIAS